MEWPKISVIIPVLNAAAYLERAILSVLEQHYPNLELIVMDGGSTDGSVDILRRYADRLACWRTAKDHGQADAINGGMAISTGDILCWLNADDGYTSGTFQAIAAYFSGRLDRPLLVYGDVRYFRDGDEQRSGLWKAAAFDPERFKRNCYLPTAGFFWTRPVWTRNGTWNTAYDYVFDWDWLIRASSYACFEPVDRVCVHFRMHTAQKSLVGGGRRRAEIAKVVQDYAGGYWGTLFSLIQRHYDRLMEPKAPADSWSGLRHRLWLFWHVPALFGAIRRIEDYVEARGMLTYEMV